MCFGIHTKGRRDRVKDDDRQRRAGEKKKEEILRERERLM